MLAHFFLLFATFVLKYAVGCSLDFATGTTFDGLISREGYTVLFVYSPQGKSVDSHLGEVLNFSATCRSTYPQHGPESVYCPHVILADGVSFDPFEERVFQRIRQHAQFAEDTPQERRATVHKLQAMGFDTSPALALLRGGKVIETWDTEISSRDMLALLRSSIDSRDESLRAELASEPDVLTYASDQNREFKSTLIVPHFTRITDELRRDIYAIGASIVRPSKGSKTSKALFADAAHDGILYIYSVVPKGHVAAIVNMTQDVSETGNAPIQWERRLAEQGLTLLRAPVDKSTARLLGSDLKDGISALSLVAPRVVEGYRHILSLPAARRRSECVVTLFVKEITDDIGQIYRSRIAKVAETKHENTTLGDRCTFIVADADLNARYFTSFGLMFKALYRNAQETKGRPSTLLLPQSRQRFSDNLIGAEFDGRRYLYPEASFNVPLLAQFVKRVLLGRAVRVRQCEQDRSGSSNFAARLTEGIHILESDCDTLYYEGLKDFRRDTLVIELPSSKTRSCFVCALNGTWCHWNASSSRPSICRTLETEGHALSEVFNLMKPSIAKELAVVYYVSSLNDANPYLRLPQIKGAKSDTMSLMYMHRADKLAYFKRQTAFQPGVHDHHLKDHAVDTLKVSSLALSKQGSLASRVDRILQFLNEAGESLSVHMVDVPVFVSTAEESFDDDEF